MLDLWLRDVRENITKQKFVQPLSFNYYIQIDKRNFWHLKGVVSDHCVRLHILYCVLVEQMKKGGWPVIAIDVFKLFVYICSGVRRLFVVRTIVAVPRGLCEQRGAARVWWYQLYVVGDGVAVETLLVSLRMYYNPFCYSMWSASESIPRCIV